MILNPAIITLLVGTLLTVGFAVYSSMVGLRIVRYWDLSSGSAGQIHLERQTYLISTVMTCLLGFEIFSLFLFIYTADHLHPMFVGAMCAAGSLHVNGFGYPALIIKCLSVLCCGIWLIVNQTDNQAEDYPLILFKYRFLFWIALLLTLSAFLQIAYFKGLEAQVITSCCGTLFSTDATSIAGEIASLPTGFTRILFFVVAALHLRTALHLLVTGRGGRVMGWISVLFLAVSAMAIVSFISVYYYELPTHHCPFDILQRPYGYVGYLLYASLFTCGISGIAVGVLTRFEAMLSLSQVLPGIRRRYTLISLLSSLIFLALSIYPMVFSDFKLTVS